MKGYFKTMRSDEARDLRRDPNAYTLLSGIADRARWKEGTSIYGLGPGQAMIGDHREFGLTQKEYRCAKERLERYGLASFRGANRGTVATILTRDVFDIFGDKGGKQKASDAAHKGQPEGDQGATNEDEEKKGYKGNPKEARGRETNVSDFDHVMDPGNDAVEVALGITGEWQNAQAVGFLRKALRVVGDSAFRQEVYTLFREMKCDDIEKPGAVLTKKLTSLMRARER